MRAQIVYATRNGGTAGLARMIADAFIARNWQVELRRVDESPKVADVDAVVIGGPLYANRWPRALRRWVRRHDSALQRLPVWLFSSGPLDDSARSGDLAPVPGVVEIARSIEAAGHMTFGGYLAAQPKGFIARSMAKRSAGDWRDPQHVAEWVREITRTFDVRSAIPTQRAARPAARTPVRKAAAKPR